MISEEFLNLSPTVLNIDLGSAEEVAAEQAYVLPQRWCPVPLHIASNRTPGYSFITGPNNLHKEFYLLGYNAV
jgi:hypothetical protein